MFKLQLLILLSYGSAASAMEKTTVLPRGVRNLVIKHARTTVSGQSDSMGKIQPLFKPLGKEIKVKDSLKEFHGVEKALKTGFFSYLDMTPDTILGQFGGDLKAKVHVTAPVFAYGLTNYLTLALAIPIYQAYVGTGLTLKSNEQASLLVNKLDSQFISKTAEAIMATGRFNDGLKLFNSKLQKFGYQNLSDWQGNGIGDVTLAAKYKVQDSDNWKVAYTNGFVLPTGRVQDPNNLIDLPFGKGSFNVFAQAASDIILTPELFINTYGKFTYHFPTSRDIRHVTASEPLDGPVVSTQYQLGSEWELGASTQYESELGPLAAIGYRYEHHYQDIYDVDNYLVRQKLETNTKAYGHYVEGKIGYSSVKPYQRGTMPLPFSVHIEYAKHLASVNTKVKDLVTAEIALYF